MNTLEEELRALLARANVGTQTARPQAPAPITTPDYCEGFQDGYHEAIRDMTDLAVQDGLDQVRLVVGR